MRAWLWGLAALLLCAFGAQAAAQTPLDCAAVGQSVCEDGEILALEGERAALIDQLATLDPQNPALAGEQLWLDGLGACGEDPACYRTAYLNHNQMLRQSLSALPGAGEAPAPEELEAPPDATMEPAPPPRAERAPTRRREERSTPRDAYVASGLPGWGFFTAIGLSGLIFWALMRALRKNRRELRAHEAALRAHEAQSREDDWG